MEILPGFEGNYDGLTNLRKWLRKKFKIKVYVGDLLVMSHQADPFYAGGKADKREANWFANLWKQFKFEVDTHIRKIHYFIQSLGNVKKSDGKVYQGLTDTEYGMLGYAAARAREMGLVPAEDFVDRRNPPPVINVRDEYRNPPSWETTEGSWYWPQIYPSLNAHWELPECEVYGYYYDESLQPYHIEVWCEKSTMDYILKPLCERYCVNYVPAVGNQSISNVVKLLKERMGDKPCRIFYISDFDISGEGMPREVARQIEFWLYFYDMKDDVDIKLIPLVLTEEQVEAYNLPRVPIPATDKRKPKHEKKHGKKGRVELDALESLHPGELKKIVSEAIEKFRDSELKDKMEEAEDEAEDTMQQTWGTVMAPYQAQSDKLKAAVEKVTNKYSSKVSQLNDAMQSELEPLKQQMESLRQTTKKAGEQMRVALPELPEPEVEGDEKEWLFDSGRDYLEQLKVYKQWYNEPWFMDRLPSGKTKNSKEALNDLKLGGAKQQKIKLKGC